MYCNGRVFLVRICLWSAVALSLHPVALAQMDTATLVGRVVDASGVVIAGARVELVDIDRNIKSAAQTNRSGIYAFPNARPGHYRATVSAPGYRTAILPNLTIYVQDDIQQNFRLISGAALGSVTMQANGTPVETTGAVGTVVEEEMVKELPLNGRSFQTLFQLTPGIVIAPTNFASQGQFSVNGQRTNTNYFIVDGVSANFGIAAGVNPGQSAGGSLPALTAFGGTNSLVITDDVQEFAVLTSSYSAQFGRMPGGQISVVTRSGTNELHGTLFEYLRNDAFDANDWFANRDNLGRAALRQNDYGATLGGPLLRNTTFFFLSYEGLRLRQPSSEKTDVPSVTVRRSAPASLQPVLNAYPLPNGPEEGPSGLAHAAYSFSNPSSLDTGSVRIDRQIREHLSVFARYDESVSDHQDRGAGINSLSTVTDTRFALKTLTGGLIYRPSSTWINDLRLNWSESSASARDHLDALGGAVPITPQLVSSGSAVQDGLIQFVSASKAQHGQLSMGQNVANLQRQMNVVNNASLQTGSHLFKMGIDLRRFWTEVAPAKYEQQDVLSDLTSAHNRTVSLALIGASASVRSEFGNYSAYAQDGWRPTVRLSITSGVRWDYNTAPTGRGSNGLQPVAVSDINSLATLSIAPQGTPLYHAPLSNFVPRFGMAYELRSSPGTETVIRAAGGGYYDLANVSAGGAVGTEAFPFFAHKILVGVPFPLSPTDAQAPALTLGGPVSTIVSFAPNLKLPCVWQWNVAIQQSFRGQQQLTVSYVGAVGSHLLRTEEYVGGRAGLSLDFGQLLFTNNAAYSGYNSLQVQFQRRVTAGAHILAHYTFSRSMDNASTDAVFDGIPGRFLDPRSDYGPSDFDIRHTATIGLDYIFPSTTKSNPLRWMVSNWAIGSLAMFRSAPPVNVVVSRDIGFGTYEFRPDLIRGAPLYSVDAAEAGGKAINSAALSVAAANRQGTLSRNFFRGFNFFQVDLSLRKHFRVSDRVGFQARVETFNLLNRPNFAPPSGELGSVDFAGKFVPNLGFGLSRATLGRGLRGSSAATFASGFSPLYQVGSARSIQLAFKVDF